MFLPFKGKEQLTDEILGLFSDLNKDKLRISRPSKPIFLCGGLIKAPNPPPSLRDYILRNFKPKTPLDGQVILAEAANQLYRETAYSDLITFEEDIAQIASIILVIAESPGSLAELGAFASNHIMRSKLRIILKEQHANEESSSDMARSKE
ncbi:MAG: retron St85 family effector protein [Rhodoblastus sp.]